VSYNNAHFSFGASHIQWMKGLEDDACEGGGFEEDPSPAYAYA
jgi:hypothetical protein